MQEYGYSSLIILKVILSKSFEVDVIDFLNFLDTTKVFFFTHGRSFHVFDHV